MTTNSDIATEIAGQGWLGFYIEYAKSLTRAPAMFHIATGLTCLSVACGSRVSWRDFGDKEIWPNLYVLVLGKTALGKTTSTNIGTDLLRSALRDSVISDDFTPEALIRELANRPPGEGSLLYAEEFGTLLAASGKSYNDGLKPVLTQLYDPRDTYKRNRSSKEAGGEVSITRPALSMLAGSTTEWLVHHLDEIDFKSGFIPRIIFFPQDDSDMEPEPDAHMFGHRDDALYRALRNPLADLAMSQRANVIFDDHAIQYRRRWADAQQGSNIVAANEDMRGMVQRISATVFKISALLAVSDFGVQKTYVVDISVVKRATLLVGWLIKHSVDLFDRYIIFDEFEKDAQAMLDWIPDEGISRADLLRYSRKQLSEFERIVITLDQRGDIERTRMRPEGSAKPIEMIHRIYRPVKGVGMDIEIEPLSDRQDEPQEVQSEMESAS